MTSNTVKQILGESVTGKSVVVKQRSMDYQVCPHCNEEIHEKSLFTESGDSPYMVHSCGGKVLLPETDPSTVVDWLRPYVEQQIEKRRVFLAREAV
jgi:hypothetical protein